jgi:hypothetical protein
MSITDAWIEHHFDHLSPNLSANLHGTLERMRQKCPVLHSDQYGGFWVRSRYDDRNVPFHSALNRSPLSIPITFEPEPRSISTQEAQ